MGRWGQGRKFPSQGIGGGWEEWISVAAAHTRFLVLFSWPNTHPCILLDLHQLYVKSKIAGIALKRPIDSQLAYREVKRIASCSQVSFPR